MAFLANLFGRKKKKEVEEPMEQTDLSQSAENSAGASVPLAEPVIELTETKAESVVESSEMSSESETTAESLPEQPTASEEARVEEAGQEKTSQEEITEEVVAEPTEERETPKEEKKSFWARVKAGILKTKNAIFGGVDNLLKHFVRVDEDLLEELEELLISADVGVNTTEQIIDELRDRIKDGRLKEKEQITDTLREILEGLIGEGEALNLSTKPSVILVIGVNGVGKTTAIGKISNRLRKSGKKVVVAAADTFRAAAIDQLEVWCERAKVQLVRQNEGSDPAAVVFDACHAAKNQNADVLIIDTAGRLHNKTNLMNELAKINRVIDRELPGVARENLLVLDATTGQNAILQAKEFRNAAALTGLILNKMDGTAKGGIVLAIRQELGIPVKFIGVGEKIDDMQEFDQKEFIKALFD